MVVYCVFLKGIYDARKRDLETEEHMKQLG